MSGSVRLRHAAVIVLAAVLLSLTAISVFGAASTRQSAVAASRSAELAEAYDRAFSAVAAEESLERKYRLEPGPAVRGTHGHAAEELQRALADVYARGNADDRALVASLRSLHDGYVTAIARMFAAVDGGDERTVLRIDNEQVDPAFSRISELVESATEQHERAARDSLRRLHRVEGIVFATTTAGFAIGLALLVAFGLIAANFQRTLLRQAADSRHRALHDTLTGLPNRALLHERLTQSLADELGEPAVMMIDLDRFKDVNDILGHEYGDDLLRQVAHRIRTILRAEDTVARLSADEFAVLLPATTGADALAMAERLIGEMHRSFIVGHLSVDVEAGIGVAVAGDGTHSADVLLRRADIAMHTAKDAKTGAVLYHGDMQAAGAGRLSLLGDLRRALEAGDQLTLHYQPKIDLVRGDVCGAEALLRWQHPVHGTVAPADFIPIAETTGLINHLTVFVLREAIRQARAWLDAGQATPVAVNLSPRCLLDPTLVAQVRQLLQEAGLPATLLRLEVTETAVMANPAVAMATLDQLHEQGIKLSIDDYGTGYSSMAYLKRLPVDEIKIDRSFVLGMDRDHNDAILVRGAVDLGHNLGLTVVAEGVEGATHVAALRHLGCDIAQGFHYARPMPSDDFGHWLQKHRANAVVATPLA